MGTGELLGKLTHCRGVSCDGLASHPGGVEILLATSCLRNQDKVWQLQFMSHLAPGLHFYFQLVVNLIFMHQLHFLMGTLKIYITKCSTKLILKYDSSLRF